MHLRRKRPRGFTLIELMAALVIAAVLVMVAVPAYSDAVLSSQLRSVANDLLAGARLARSEAIKRNAPVTLCVSTDGSSCGTGGWEQGWIVLSGTTVLMRRLAAPTGFKVTASGSTTTFNFPPMSAAVTTGTWTVCRAKPRAGREERVVTVGAAGRVWVQTTRTGVCT